MNQKHQNVPIWEKANLTLEEAAAFTNIGINKLRQLTDEDGCVDCHSSHDGDNTVFLLAAVHVEQHFECTSCHTRFFCLQS